MLRRGSTRRCAEMSWAAQELPRRAVQGAACLAIQQVVTATGAASSAHVRFETVVTFHRFDADHSIFTLMRDHPCWSRYTTWSHALASLWSRPW